MKKIFRKLLQNCDLFKGKVNAFTLAEVLITLGIIGIVAAVTIPTLMKNYQERVRAEQVRMVKYKLTQATSVMNTDGLIKAYPSTQAFVNVLKKYLKISKICDNNHLTDCWPTTEITVPNSTGQLTTTSVSEITTGEKLLALGIGTKNTDTMGIVLTDGTPIILTYSPVCTSLNQYDSYPYSTVDGKPVTNATTNCISAIFDINGPAKPNRIGADVRTLNSLFGAQRYDSYDYATKADCEKLMAKGLVKECHYDNDYWIGAMKKCDELGMHLPDMQTLANIAGAYYGRTDIGTYSIISNTGPKGTYTNMCEQFPFYERNNQLTNMVCANGESIPSDTNSSILSITGDSGSFWSSSEYGPYHALKRNISTSHSNWDEGTRNVNAVSLCVGD